MPRSERQSIQVESPLPPEIFREHIEKLMKDADEALRNSQEFRDALVNQYLEHSNLPGGDNSFPPIQFQVGETNYKVDRFSNWSSSVLDMTKESAGEKEWLYLNASINPEDSHDGINYERTRDSQLLEVKPPFNSLAAVNKARKFISGL